MKTHHDIVHEGTLGNDRVRMTFDESSLAHLMSVLTDLYADPAMAVVREYSTNALDSHRAAGNPDPIEVETPNQMNPTLVIRDKGLGLSVDQIRDQFSKYGWSSKRDTDEQVGMLGLGCKSGLAYTSQFTIIAVQNGRRTVVLVTRESDGAAAVQIIDGVDTDDPNGVEVQIPVSNIWTMNQKVQQFFSYWNTEDVLIDGEHPVNSVFTSTHEHLIKLDDDVVITKGSRDTIVMGGVAYEVPAGYGPGEADEEAALPRWRNSTPAQLRLRFVARVPIGSVDFAPSREQLTLTKRTVWAIEAAREFVKQRTPAALQSAMSSATTGWEAIRLASELRRQFHRFDLELTWNGMRVPNGLATNQMTSFAVSCWPNSWNKDVAAKSTGGLTYDKLNAASLLVTGFGAKFVAAGIKAKARKHVADKHPERRGSIEFLECSRSELPMTWIDTPIVDVDWLRDNIELDKTTTSTTKKRAPYVVMVGSSIGEYQDFPDDVVAWGPARKLQYQEAARVTGAAGGAVVSVLAKDEARFQRDHPDVPTLADRLLQRVDEINAAITPEAAFREKMYEVASGDTDWPQIHNRLRTLGAWSKRELDLIHDKALVDLARRIHEASYGYESQFRLDLGKDFWNPKTPLPDLTPRALQHLAELKEVAAPYALLLDAVVVSRGGRVRDGRVRSHAELLNKLHFAHHLAGHPATY